ncbi:MAG: SLBB domain-containing protein, partial [Candidatus Nealsonbacteria bacterium]|nr:SLBB domain-containing protein [Candidatus Nealsonbacteria bacterium]
MRNIPRFFAAVCVAALFASLFLPFSYAQIEGKSETPSLRRSTSAQQSLPPEKADTTAIYGRAEIQAAVGREPVAAAAVDPHYMLGPRDEIIVNLWGKETRTLRATVDETGYVIFAMPDEVGEDIEIRFSVNGLFFSDLKKKVARELSRETADIDPLNLESSAIQVDVTLGRIRGIHVTVMGEVAEPGNYQLKTTVSSVLDMLGLCGNVTARGSLREIRVRRGDGNVDEIDLYQYLLSADQLAETLSSPGVLQLREGDIMIVPPLSRTVTFKEGVKRPGSYELRDSDCLGDVVGLAGGLTPSADPQRVTILRSKDQTGMSLLGADLTRDVKRGLFDGDVIDIASKAKVRRLNAVEILGEAVKQPGRYEFQEGMTVSDLIERGGGLYEDAMLDSVVFVRTLDDYSQDFMTLDLTSSVEEPDPKSMPLRPLDKLVVYSKFDVRGGEKYVKITGHVKEPGEVPLSADMTLSDLVFMSGGFADEDFLKEAYLERGDIIRQEHAGVVNIPFHLDRLLAEDPAENHLLQSQDSVRIYTIAEIEGEKTVSVSGHVKQPGAYPLQQDMRVADLLFLGGGFSDAGHLVTTYLDRADIVRLDPITHEANVIPVNLRKVLAGDALENIALQRLDRLHVYALEEFLDIRTATIEGEVRTPGKYDLIGNMMLTDLISRANGLTDRADHNLIEIARFPDPGRSGVDSARRIVTSLSEGSGILLQPDDHIVVRRRAERRDKGSVSVKGYVAYPGTYVLLSHTETLSDVIERAGGFIEAAAPEAATLTRKVVGIVSINMVEALRNRHGPSDLVLVDGDEVFVPKENWTVEIRGQVRVPKVLQYVAGAKVSDYLEQVGGRLKNTKKSDVVIIYPNGVVNKARRDFWPFYGWREVRPGSVIVVADKSGALPTAEVAKAAPMPGT